MDIRIERRVGAAPDRVMQALIDPTELLVWCCETAKVGDGAYRLQGKAVPQTAMGGTLLERTERVLRFAWTLRTVPASGEASVVEVTLDPVDGGTVVRLSHTGVPKGALPGNRWEKDSWECVWYIWLRLLGGWVERREVVGQFDYSAPVQALPFVRQLMMPVAADRIWRALVDEEVRQRWLTVPLGEELSRQEGRQITFDWPMPEGPDQERITWALEPQGADATLVTLRHHGLPVSLWDLEVGWHDYLVALYQEAVT